VEGVSRRDTGIPVAVSDAADPRRPFGPYALLDLLGDSGDGVVVADSQRVYWANEAYARIFGYSLDEVFSPGFRPADRVPADEQDRLARLTGQREKKPVQRYELWCVRKDGTRILVEVSVRVLDMERDPKRIAILRDITSRGRDEQLVRDQRDLYETLLRAQGDIGEGVLLAEMRPWRVVFANGAFASILGMPIEEVRAGKFRLEEKIIGSDLERALAEYTSKDPLAPAHYTLRIRRGDGAARMVEVASVGVSIKGQYHRLSLWRDVSEISEWEAERRRRDEFLRDATLGLLETSLDPEETIRRTGELAVRDLADLAHVDLFEGDAGIRRVAIAAKDPAIRAASERHSRRYPPPAQLRTFVEGIPPGGAEVRNNLGDDLIRKYIRDPAELEFVHQLGIRHTMVVPLVSRRGVIGLVGFSRTRDRPFSAEDVSTATSLAVRSALAYDNAVLHVHNQRILETAPVQILTIDERGSILSINRSVREEEPDLILGTNAFDTIVPEDRERVKQLIFGAIQSGKPCEYQTRAILGPGKFRWFNVRVGPLELGTTKGAVLISTDIEERKEIEEQMATVRAQLIQSEKLAALGGLVSGLAHELRTPLTYLSTNATILERRMEKSASEGRSADEILDGARPLLHDVHQAVVRINELVEDLRRYTRGQVRTLQAAALEGLLGEAIEIFRATNRGAYDVEEVLEPTQLVLANRGAIQQLVLNLLQNAAEASPPGSGIVVRTYQDGDRAVLAVEDRGRGIDATTRGRMFDPLFTTKPDGTGLGLTIVRRIVDEHHGTIDVSSEVGKGTTFRVLFPCIPQAA
jgi:PAS domain S-box-containing protein